MTAHLTLKKSLLPNKKGITVKHRMQPMEIGWINWTLPFKYSKQNSLELHLLQKLYEANSDKTEKINIPDILQK